MHSNNTNREVKQGNEVKPAAATEQFATSFVENPEISDKNITALAGSQNIIFTSAKFDLNGKQTPLAGSKTTVKNESKKTISVKKVKHKSSGRGIRGLLMVILALALIGLGYLFYIILGVLGIILLLILGIGGAIFLIMGLLTMMVGKKHS